MKRKTSCNPSRQKFDIFTPDLISKEMASHFPKTVDLLLEPSIGSGNLLTYVKYTKCIGYDINADYTSKIKQNVEIRHENFILADVVERFDGIIMNPPYLRFQEMPDDMRLYITNNFPELSSGNIDLYLAFVMKAFRCLSDDGKLVAIVPASYLYNVSSKKFRNFILENKHLNYVKNFEDVKVFSDADVYCSILVLTKKPNDSYVYETLTTKTTKTHDQEILSETEGVPFETYCEKITNGIATLADKVFIQKDKLFDEPCWKPIYKISTQETRWILYPYNSDGVIIPEEQFLKTNPLSYAYLLRNKEILMNRDKGKKTYKAWYAFGREQSIKVPTKQCLFVPTMSSETLDKVCVKDPILFYSGICIIPSIDATVLHTKMMKSSQSLCELCSKRSGKWINITVGVLRNFKVTE